MPISSSLHIHRKTSVVRPSIGFWAGPSFEQCTEASTFITAFIALVVRPDHRPAVSLVVERESEKRGPGRPEESKNRTTSRTGIRALGDAMEVDSLASERPAAKRPRQATLSFGVDG
jgi:hypothetical protein